MPLEAHQQIAAGREFGTDGQAERVPATEPLHVVASGAPASTLSSAETVQPSSLLLVTRKAREALARGMRGVGYIVGMVSSHSLSRSYWPEAPRKSKPRVLLELLWWLLRYGEVNHYYYLYGLDRKDVRRTDVIPYRVFRRRRNQLNLCAGRMPYNYVCVLRDKFLFAQLLSSIGAPAPKSFAVFDHETANWLDRKRKVPLARVAESAQARYDGFCKRIDGTQGQGAFPLQIERGRISSNGIELSSDEFCKLIDGRFLFQARIEQHPAMSSLHPASVNTVRLVSYYRAGKPTIFCASARMGTAGRSVDNWSAGGLTIGVDVATGELKGEAFFKPGTGGRVTRHPDTGIAFESFRIPHFHEAVELVKELHEYLPQIHSIGWDIAISTQGPMVIEGNDDWHGIVPMLHERDVRRRLDAMFECR
jgi:hypothetical protein